MLAAPFCMEQWEVYVCGHRKSYIPKLDNERLDKSFGCLDRKRSALRNIVLEVEAQDLDAAW